MARKDSRKDPRTTTDGFASGPRLATSQTKSQSDALAKTISGGVEEALFFSF